MKHELWDTCNNLVISWLHRSVSEQIKKSILYYNTAREIWLHLETCYNDTNGARKYKLNKEVYDTHQNGASVSEYYTAMKSLWDEQDSLNLLPSITQLNPEIDAFMGAMKKQKEEERLFQFLLGIDEDYHAQRSQLLMQTPLPIVEAACAQLQQEETQRDVLQLSKLTLDSSAMLSKGKTEDRGSVTCEACGKRGHKAEKC
ncbi:Gag polyprotein [Bienertia sinuspersici]